MARHTVGLLRAAAPITASRSMGFDRRFLRTLIPWVLLAGCAGSDSPTDAPDDPGDGGGNTASTDQKRMATLQAVWDRIPALAGTDADSRRNELLTFLRSRPEFAASGANEDGSLWARFTDGRLLLIIANRDELTEAGAGVAHLSSTAGSFAAPSGAPPAVATAHVAAPQLAAVAAPPAELPSSTQARILGGGEPANGYFMSTFIPQLRGMLTAGGYQMAPGAGTGTIDDLLGISGDGVFYFGGHGGWGTNGAGDQVYGVTTGTTVSLRNDSIYSGLWLDSSLVYTMPITPGVRPPFLRCQAPCVGYYAFTAKFVEKHMGRFASGSVVYIGACSSYDAGFRQAFLDKGAGVYFGWTAPFQAGIDAQATLFLFDRLLGLNDPGVPQENPPQRPFDYVSVHRDMDRPSRGLTRSGAARLVYTPGGTESGLLAPSIRYMQVNEFPVPTLVLTGKFGSDPRSAPGGGEVTINGSSTGQLRIVSWGKEQITVEIPVSGPNSAGDVVVWSRGRQSNTRRLTQWKWFTPEPPLSASSSTTNWAFNLQFITGSGTLKWEGGVHPHIRVDVSSYREEAGDQPKYDSTIPFQIAYDSYGEMEASGTYAHGTNGLETWSGVAQITTRLKNPAAVNVVDGVGEIDPESRFMRLALYISVADGMIGVNQAFTYTIPAVWVSNDGPMSPMKPLPSLYLPLDLEFGIISDMRRQAPTGPSSILYWSNLKPNYMPDNDLAR